MTHLMVLTQRGVFSLMMHCFMKQSVVKVMFRLIYLDQKLGNKSQRWNSTLQGMSKCKVMCFTIKRDPSKRVTKF